MFVTKINRATTRNRQASTESVAGSTKQSVWLVGSVEALLKRHTDSGEMHFLLLKRVNGQLMRCKWRAENIPSLPEVGQIIRVELENSVDVITQNLNRAPYADGAPLITDSKTSYFIRAWHCNQTCYSPEWLERIYFETADVTALERLWQVIRSLPVSCLKDWMFEVFAQPDFSIPFVRVAASHSHHHSHAGGLLVHSVECAEWVAQVANNTLNPKEAALAITAALLHDAGKIVTMQPGNDNPSVAHEVLTLTVLEPALIRLQQQWSSGAYALRQMLSWSSHYEKFPRLPGTLLVKMADQFSTALSARNKAFEAAPAYYHWAKLQTSSSVQFFNRIN